MNDAPLACLTTSNSVAEIKTGRKVMGIKMTEEVRKLAQFFLKKFPLSVKERHLKTPEPRDYFDTPFSAVLGGSCRSVSDLMDKILLANSLLDNASTLSLVGEIGAAATSALDIEVSRVERFASAEAQKAEFASVKPFFVRLFEKAAEKGVNIQLPPDYVTSAPLDVTKYSAGGAPQTAESQPKQEATEEKSTGSKLRAGRDSSMAMNPPAQQTAEEQQESSVQEIDNSRERAIVAANPSMHWSDVMIQAEKARTIDLRELIQSRMNKICAEHIAKSEAMRPQSSAAMVKPLANLDSVQKFSALSSSPPNASQA